MDVFSWQNMHDLELNFKCNPVKSVTIKSEFHAFWNKGRDDTALRFLIEQDKELSVARLALVRGAWLQRPCW